MKKLLFCVIAILFSCTLFAQDEEVMKKTWEAYSTDMPSNAVSTVKIKKRIGGIYEMTYEEKETFTPSAEDKKRGFAMYVKRFGELIYPNMVPHKDELKSSLDLTATPGEYEAGVFVVYALSALDKVSVTVTDLVKDKAKIPASEIEVRNIIYDFEPRGAAWYCITKHALKGNQAKALKEIPRPFLVTVKLPENAEAGTYSGTLKVNGGAAAGEFKFNVNVLPFKFEPLSEEHAFWVFTYSKFRQTPEFTEKLVLDLKAHGMNTYHMSEDLPSYVNFDNGGIKLNVELMDKTMKILKKHGFKKVFTDPGTIPALRGQRKCKAWSAEFNKDFKEYHRQFKEAAEKNKWPQIIYMFDEPREGEDDSSAPYRSYTDMMNLAKMAPEMGIEAMPNYMVDYGGKRWDDKTKEANYDEIVPFTKYTCTHGWGPSKKVIANATKPGKVLYLYNNGFGRLPYGLLALKYGAMGQSQFWYTNGNKTLDSVTGFPGSAAATITAEEELIPTLKYEESREGIDDYKYVWTLRKALESAKDKNSPEAVAADKLVKEITSIELVDSTVKGAEGDTTSPYAIEKYNPKVLEEFRARVIKAILAMRK